MSEKTNITAVIPNSSIGTTKGVIVNLSSLYINNDDTSIKETRNGKHLIHIYGTLVGDTHINYLAKHLNIVGSIVDPQYHNTDINITYWINGDISDKRRKYLERNFIKGACAHNVVLEVIGYDVQYHQLKARWLSNGSFDLPNNTPNTSNNEANRNVNDDIITPQTTTPQTQAVPEYAESHSQNTNIQSYPQYVQSGQSQDSVQPNTQFVPEQSSQDTALKTVPHDNLKEKQDNHTFNTTNLNLS